MIGNLTEAQLAELLDQKVDEFNQPGFIENDPILIPHSYSLLQDIEITGFWTAILAWGQRKTIINKCQELFGLMDQSPFDFIVNHQESDLKRFLSFKHRTFNTTDTLYFIHFLKDYYNNHRSLEEAFKSGMGNSDETVENGLVYFRDLFFSLPDYPIRTQKHIASPATKSRCKRINMFLRWMVRNDDKGVDFGLWNKIKPSQLVCPCDLHVERVARKLGLITRKQTDWLTVLELTNRLRQLDPHDPVKYDFALFGLGLEERY
ncbi:MAG: TIGR02757 family protein [Bacteroidetes bacterium]|nr:TIGR02757 family protein [Bacteroidota bacterium]